MAHNSPNSLYRALNLQPWVQLFPSEHRGESALRGPRAMNGLCPLEVRGRLVPSGQPHLRASPWELPTGWCSWSLSGRPTPEGPHVPGITPQLFQDEIATPQNENWNRGKSREGKAGSVSHHRPGTATVTSHLLAVCLALPGPLTVILTTALGHRYGYPCSADMETEAQRG